MSKIVAIIQARMGSSRLPEKVLMPIVGKPVLWHIANRLRCVKKINKIIIATSNTEKDDKIEEFCQKYEINCFRGSEEDVLDRFYRAAEQFSADYLIRITGDCPLVDPSLVSTLIDFFLNDNFDHCGIATGAGFAQEGFIGRFPDGLDTEIFTLNALKTAWLEAKGSMFREHVTPYIWKQPDRFKIGSLKSTVRDYSEYRWTLDNIEDYELIKWIYEQLYFTKSNFNMYDIVALLEKNTEVLKKNKHLLGKEGYEQFWK